MLSTKSTRYNQNIYNASVVVVFIAHIRHRHQKCLVKKDFLSNFAESTEKKLATEFFFQYSSIVPGLQEDVLRDNAACILMRILQIFLEQLLIHYFRDHKTQHIIKQLQRIQYVKIRGCCMSKFEMRKVLQQQPKRKIDYHTFIGLSYDKFASCMSI